MLDFLSFKLLFCGNWNSRAGKLFISIELSQIVCPRFFAKGRRSFFFGARNQFDHFYTKTLKMFLFMAFLKLLFFIFIKYVILPPILHPFFSLCLEFMKKFNTMGKVFSQFSMIRHSQWVNLSKPGEN